MTVQQIPNLPAAIALSGHEQVEIVQAGVSMRATISQVSDAILTGLGTMAAQDADSVAITGGTIDGTPIGSGGPSTGLFTTLTASGAATFTGSLTAAPTGAGTVTINPTTTGYIDNMIIGATTPAAGTFTNLTATGTLSGAGFTNLLAPYAKIDSQVFTGTPSLPTGTIGVTQAPSDNSTKLATTAYVKSQGYLTGNQSISLTGDVTGSGTTSIAATVVQLQGRPVANTAPTTGYVLGWNGSTWAPQLASNAAGLNGQLQYNNSGVFGGVTDWVVSGGATGNFQPNADNAHDIGTPSIRVKCVYTTQIGSAAAPMVSGWANTFVCYGSGPVLQINKSASGQTAKILGQTTSGNRWCQYMGDGTAEAAGDVGSDFKIERYSNAGAAIDVPFFIKRSTGVATFSQIPSIPTTTPTTGDQVTSKTYVDAAIAAKASVVVSDTPPAGVPDNTLWWESDSGILYVRYHDADSTQWVSVVSANDPSTMAVRFDVAQGLTAPQQAQGRSNIGAVALAGDTMTGTLSIAPTSGDANLVLGKAASGSSNNITGYKGVTGRWQLQIGNSTAETGSNAGSDFVIARFADDGAYIDNPLLIMRGTGESIFTRQMNLNPTAGDASIILNKSASGLSDVIWGKTGGVNRWSVVPGTIETESGGNAGSNFSIGRFNDAGTYQGEAFSLRRSDGAASFYGPTYVNNTLNVSSTLGVTGNINCNAYGNFTNDITCANAVLVGGRPQLTFRSAYAENYISISDSSLNGGQYRNLNIRGIDAGGATETNLDYVKLTTNQLIVNGQVDAATCFVGRRGQWGTTGQNFSFWWDGSNLESWVSTTRVGYVSLFSDYRLKKDVTPLPSMWERARALRPISYTQKAFTPPSEIEKANKGDENDPPMTFREDSIERWGFIAHELQETLVPSAATGVKDDPNGVQTPNPWTVIAVLTKTLQEAMARIEALEARATNGV